MPNVYSHGKVTILKGYAKKSVQSLIQCFIHEVPTKLET